MSNNDRFPRHASTKSMTNRRMFTDEYLVDPRQASWSEESIAKFKGMYDYVTVSDSEIHDQMYPEKVNREGETERVHSGKSRGDCVEAVLKQKVGHSYKGLVDPDLAKSTGWQAKESVYDLKNGVTYYFFKQKGDSNDEETDQPAG